MDDPTCDIARQERNAVPQGHHINKFTEEELEQARTATDRVVVTRPPLLGYPSVILIIVNRMIGTGIFRTPTILAQYTHSTAYPLLFWSAGAIVGVCGAYVFAEFGLTVPQLRVPGGTVQSVPRNGGEKWYLEYLLKAPRRLATSLYGIPFIVLGTAAGNALICAESLLRVTAGFPSEEPSKSAVRGLAIGIVTFTCLLHAVSRKGGIYLFNIFGSVKIGLLLSMFASGLAYTGGAFGGSNAVARENLNVDNSFNNSAASAYGFAEAFLAVLFAMGGYQQSSYVLGECAHGPRRNYKITTIGAVFGVGTLYVLVNLAYMMVVPEIDQIGLGGDTVTALFFQRIFGLQNGSKVQHSFLTFSSFGNVLVQTYTGARVKQELAKEGILPWTKFFASNQDLVPKFWTQRGNVSQSARRSSATPVGALVLHWGFSLALILATIPTSISESYIIFVSLYSYVIDAFFGFAVGLGLLTLRLREKSQWSKMSTVNSKYCSITAALVFTLANFLSLVVIWVPPHGFPQLVIPMKWWTTGVVGMGLVGFASLYWIMLTYIIPFVRGRDLEVDRQIALIRDHDDWVVLNEITSVNWRIRST